MTKWICNECKFIGQVCKCETANYAPFFCVIHKVKQADWRIDNTDLNTATMERVETETELPKLTAEVFERPAKLPDWCKVGKFAYSTVHKEYVVIFDIGEFEVSLKGGACCAVGCKTFVEDYKPARIRPWTKEEAIGKVVRNALCVGIITYADKFKCIVGTKVITLKELSEEYTEQDGAPCGKFEHLNDAGEWME